jgi:hypothetical protein
MPCGCCVHSASDVHAGGEQRLPVGPEGHAFAARRRIAPFLQVSKPVSAGELVVPSVR